jgi:hypothetical protein
MSLLLIEKDADAIYEECQELGLEEQFDEDEYREDKMEQMISRNYY